MITQIYIVTDLGAQKKANGFTLVELMIVIFIVGLMSAVVIITIPDAGNDVRQDSEQFAARVAAARDNAILQSRPMALWVAKSGYGFEILSGGQWIAPVDNAFASQNWQGSELIIDRQGPIRIIFDSTGLPSDSFTINLQNAQYTRPISLNAAGDIKIGE